MHFFRNKDAVLAEDVPYIHSYFTIFLSWWYYCRTLGYGLKIAWNIMDVKQLTDQHANSKVLTPFAVVSSLNVIIYEYVFWLIIEQLIKQYFDNTYIAPNTTDDVCVELIFLLKINCKSILSMSIIFFTFRLLNLLTSDWQDDFQWLSYVSMIYRRSRSLLYCFLSPSVNRFQLGYGRCQYLFCQLKSEFKYEIYLARYLLCRA